MSPLPRVRPKLYIQTMDNNRKSAALFLAKIGAGLVLLAAATGAAFAAWIDNGPEMLMSMAETGLSWCF
jgi:hypothetical protein